MEYRQLGGSDMKVPVVTFGAWAIGGWMWGGADEKDAIAAIHKAIDLGVTAIDTAAVYGFGRSEEIVGKALRGRREKVLVFTKYGLRWDRPGEGEIRFDTMDNEGRPTRVMRNSRPDSVIEECERSLKRLGVDRIDLYQCHWPDPTTPIDETMGAIGRLIEQGKVRASGVSNYSPEQMAEAHAVVPLTASQPPYSMINRAVEGDVLPWCREHNVGVVCYSPMQRGLLTGKFEPDHRFAEGDHRAENPFFRPGNIRKVNALLEKLRPIAEAHGATLAQLAVRWAIQQPGVAAALVGARNPRQISDSARAGEFALGGDELKAIDVLLAGVNLDLSAA